MTEKLKVRRNANKNQPTPKNEGPEQSQENYRLLVESISDYAIFMLDCDGHVQTWNKGAEKIKGYKADQILGSHFSVFYSQEDCDRAKPQWELGVAKAEGSIEDEGWRIRQDGSKFWANVIITALFDETGVLKGFAKITRDLTERRNSEENLKKAYSSLEKIVEAGNTTNRELRDLNRSMAGREYRIRELENEVNLLKLRLSMSDPLAPSIE